MTKEQVETIVKRERDAILTIQDESVKKGIRPARGWKQKEQHVLIKRVVLALQKASKPEEFGADLSTALECFSAGNASAYRQALSKAKLITESANELDEYQ